MENRYPPWNPIRMKRRLVADRGGVKRWRKNRKHVKREILR